MRDFGIRAAAGFILFMALLAAGFILFMALLIGGIAWIVNATSLPGALAEIEQLRIDSAGVDPDQAEDVIGQVTQWNQTISSTQAMNHQWWAGWTVPDEWDDVEPIPVPQQ